MDLSKFTTPTFNNDAIENFTFDNSSSVDMLTIETIPDLIQFIGYAKYISSNYMIMLRGQNEAYKTLKPSLLRNNNKVQSLVSKWNKRITRLKKSYWPNLSIDNETLGALLQHYGFKTPFLDVVDNIWVALWFATHKTTTAIADAHEHIIFSENDREFSYILLLRSDAVLPDRNEKGVYEGDETRLVDLRKAVPSIYLRPHAQHAYIMIDKRSDSFDYSDYVVAIVKIPTNKGLEWIGNGALLSTASLLPSAVFDSGYRHLLKTSDIPTEEIEVYGSIQIIS